MSEWKKVKLKDCCIKIGSGSTPKGGSMVYVNSGTSLIRSQNVYNLSFDYNGLTHITEDAANKLKGVTVFNEDILLNITGDSVARTCIVPKEVLPARVNQHVAIIRTDRKKMNWRFLNYYLASPKMQAHMLSLAVGKGASRNALTKQMIENFEVPYPPLSTQQRIATILSRYDSLIENYQKQIKLLEEAAQRLYKEWFVDLRFPGHENTNIIDGVPDGWEKKTIDDVTCKITTGLNPRKNFVLGKGSNYYVTIKNMADNTLFLDDRCDRVDNEALEKINKRSDLKIGDILFSGIGTIGRVALVYIPTNNWNVSESVFTLRANDIVTKEFLYLMLLSPDMQNYCQSNAHGAAQKGIRMADLKAYSFNLPPFGVIQKFTNLVTPTIKKVSSIRNQIRLLTEARDRLLPKLMSGEIAV